MAKPLGAESRDQVQKILEILHKHSDVVSLSMTGSVSADDENLQKGIAALHGINAIMPVEEGIYQLNPRIRSFLSERLAQYSAMQTLTRISEQIHGGKAKWKELLEMHRSGDVLDLVQIEESLSYTLNEVVYFMGQNLRLLNHQTATDYGNVSSLKRKLRQNRFYLESVKTLMSELDQLEQFTDTVDSEALAYGLHPMRQMVNARVRSRMSEWRTQLNDIQAIIDKRLFVKRKIDRELKLLYDTVLWMVRNPTLDGIPVELGNKPQTSLLHPIPIRIRPRTDINVHGIAQENVIKSVVTKLPEATAPKQTKEVGKKSIVQSTAAEEVEMPMSEEDLLVEELIEYLRSENAKPIEISQWKVQRREAAGLSEEEWVLYATHQLAMQDIETQLQVTQAQGTFNTVFDDVMAFAAA